MTHDQPCRDAVAHRTTQTYGRVTAKVNDVVRGAPAGRNRVPRVTEILAARRTRTACCSTRSGSTQSGRCSAARDGCERQRRGRSARRRRARRGWADLKVRFCWMPPLGDRPHVAVLDEARYARLASRVRDTPRQAPRSRHFVATLCPPCGRTVTTHTFAGVAGLGVNDEQTR